MCLGPSIYLFHTGLPQPGGDGPVGRESVSECSRRFAGTGLELRDHPTAGGAPHGGQEPWGECLSTVRRSSRGFGAYPLGEFSPTRSTGFEVPPR